MKFFQTLTVMLLTAILTAPTVFAFDYDAPTCILMRFSNDTRYRKVDSASVLSDLVIEKMLKGGNFNLKETIPIDEDIETKLYNEKANELSALQSSTSRRNFDALFEGAAFDPTQAQSIATAEVGQIVSPSITKNIGAQHGAQYLIQGTVINMGNGKWINRDAEMAESAINLAMRSAGIGSISFSQQEAAIGVQVDLRVIKASTGEVVWRKIVTGVKRKSKLTEFGGISLGKLKLTSDMYTEAMEDAAQQIDNALVEDVKAHKLFVK